nr:hypothetical protein CFP56_62900 [Quercus suber]
MSSVDSGSGTMPYRHRCTIVTVPVVVAHPPRISRRGSTLQLCVAVACVAGADATTIHMHAHHDIGLILSRRRGGLTGSARTPGSAGFYSRALEDLSSRRTYGNDVKRLGETVIQA